MVPAPIVQRVTLAKTDQSTLANAQTILKSTGGECRTSPVSYRKTLEQGWTTE